MLANLTRRHYGQSAVIFGVIATAIYLLMIKGTLAHLQAISGMVPFDMRPFGYSHAEAMDLLIGLKESGRKYYLTRQIPLDTLYPALLALTLISTNNWLGAALPSRKIIHVATVVCIAAAVFDYAENIGIILMIQSWPTLPNGLVMATSLASVLKAISTTIAVLITILIAARWTLARLRSNHQPKET